jgi:hypothetical protein
MNSLSLPLESIDAVALRNLSASIRTAVYAWESSMKHHVDHLAFAGDGLSRSMNSAVAEMGPRADLFIGKADAALRAFPQYLFMVLIFITAWVLILSLTICFSCCVHSRISRRNSAKEGTSNQTMTASLADEKERI